ncbi:MAG: hypothetical protein A3I66_05115 [Burkholderiales bacterium RIFCSPLOWO2_02_FULL_57_36]|nr:MAG: hypothetical protein A3I66_05115 [Burkholderiales bacterium RIFCSPLOWO2_02_FULL_57_36]
MARLALEDVEKVNRVTLRMMKLNLISQLLNSAILFVLFFIGEVDGIVPIAYTAAAATPISIFFLLIKTGLNRNFRDPGMAMPQILLGAVMLLGLLVAMPEIGIMLIAQLFTFYLGGVLALRLDQFIFIWVAGAAALAVSLYYVGDQIGFPHSTILSKALLWVFLVSVLGYLSYVAGAISNLRLKVSEKNKKLAEALKTVEALARHDTLTGAMNRRALMECLESMIQSVKRKPFPFSIAFVDLDHFKQVNDSCGHVLGDDVLKIFASILQESVRATDRIARYGGDEFVVVLVDTAEDGASIVLERVRDNVARYDWKALGIDLNLSTSIGIASFQPGDSIEKTLARADDALYAAKSAGRNCVRVAPTLASA